VGALALNTCSNCAEHCLIGIGLRKMALDESHPFRQSKVSGPKFKEHEKLSQRGTYQARSTTNDLFVSQLPLRKCSRSKGGESCPLYSLANT